MSDHSAKEQERAAWMQVEYGVLVRKDETWELSHQSILNLAGFYSAGVAMRRQ